MKWKHFPHYWPFVWGIHRPVTRSYIFSLFCAWINGSVNSRGAGDLRRHHANYYVTLMWHQQQFCSSWIKKVLYMVCAHVCFFFFFFFFRGVFCWSSGPEFPVPSGQFINNKNAKTLYLGPLAREFTGHRCIPLTRFNEAGMVSLSP